MRIYETTFIVNPQTDDSSIDGSVKSVTDIISNNGGKILHEDRMGTRRMAYDIQGMNQGYYTSVIFEGEITILPLLQQHFKLGESFMRHLTIQFEGSLEDLKSRSERSDDSGDRDRDDRDKPRERREPAPPEKKEPETAKAEASESSEKTESTESSDDDEKKAAPAEEAKSEESGDSSEDEKEL